MREKPYQQPHTPRPSDDFRIPAAPRKNAICLAGMGQPSIDQPADGCRLRQAPWSAAAKVMPCRSASDRPGRSACQVASFKRCS